MVVAGELPREAHNAPLHLFSASPNLVAFGGSAYRRRSEDTSAMLLQLFGKLQTEDLAVPYTMEDFRRDFVKEHFPELTPQEKKELLQALPLEELLEGKSPEQIRQYLDRLSAGQPASRDKLRRKKGR